MKNNNIVKILCLFSIVLVIQQQSFSQYTEQAKTALQNFITDWFNSSNDSNWLLEINGVKFPTKGLEIGLETLENNLKKSDISKVEQQQLKARFVQTYIDQSAILAHSYKELLENPEIDILLQEFLRQAATQFWLENQMKKDPSAIVPSQDDINKYYQENSERLLRLGLSANQIKSYTEQELRQKKLQEWTFRELATFKTNNPVTINPTIKKKFNIE